MLIIGQQTTESLLADPYFDIPIFPFPLTLTESFFQFIYNISYHPNPLLGQSAGTGKYSNCISVEEEDSPNECPEYITRNNLMVRLQ